MTPTSRPIRTAVVGGEPDDWDVIDHFLGDNSLPPRFSGDSSGLRHHVDFLPSVGQDEWSNQLRRAIAHDSPYDLAVFDADTTSLPLIDMLHVFLRSTPYAHAIVLCDVESSIPFQIAERFGCCQRVVLTRKPLDQTEFSMLANMVVGKVTEQRSRQSSLVFTNNISPSAAHGQLLEAHKLLRAQADQLTERLQDTQLELINTRDVTVLALAQLADSRDPETGEHLLRMRAFAQILACYLHNEVHHPEIDDNYLAELYRSTPLHDIGKVGIPDHILLKSGKLTDDEFEIMKQHTVIGAKTLERATRQFRNSRFLHMAVDIALYHHERFNGRGYPCGLRGGEIPLSARITTLADVFDALTSARVYKTEMPFEQAYELIVAEKGEHFDPLIVDAFEHCLDDFARVKLAIDNGEQESIELSGGARIELNSIVGMECVD